MNHQYLLKCSWRGTNSLNPSHFSMALNSSVMTDTTKLSLSFVILKNPGKLYITKKPQNQDQNNIHLSEIYTTNQILTHVKSARLSSISWEHNLDRNFSEEKHSPPPKNAKTNHTKIRHSSVHFSSARDGENIWQATDFRHIPQSTGRRHASAEYRAEDRQNRHVSNDLLPLTSRHLDVPCGNKQ